jgi:uncharacterized protein
MALRERIQADLTAAMKARDTDTVATLRMALTGIRTLQAGEGRTGDVTDDEAVEVLTREARKRTEAAEAYEQAGRAELADRERRELAVLRRYLPAELDRDELAAIVDEAIASTGATTPADLGRVMSTVMPRVRGRADGRTVNALVRERLSP